MSGLPVISPALIVAGSSLSALSVRADRETAQTERKTADLSTDETLGYFAYREWPHLTVILEDDFASLAMPVHGRTETFPAAPDL
jgi:hypothetical protein